MLSDEHCSGYCAGRLPTPPATVRDRPGSDHQVRTTNEDRQQMAIPRGDGAMDEQSFNPHERYLTLAYEDGSSSLFPFPSLSFA